MLIWNIDQQAKCISAMTSANREHHRNVVSSDFHLSLALNVASESICDRMQCRLTGHRRYALDEIYADKRYRWQFPCAQFEKVKIALVLFVVWLKQSKLFTMPSSINVAYVCRNAMHKHINTFHSMPISMRTYCFLAVLLHLRFDSNAKMCRLVPKVKVNVCHISINIELT